MSSVDENGIYLEHDFVIVQGHDGKEVRIPFGQKTLAEFRTEVMQQLYPKLLKEYPNATPQTLRLIWCGKQIEPGCTWHTGIIPLEDEIKMRQLNPNCKDGLPMIIAHATGGNLLEEPDEEVEEEYDHSEMSSMNNIKLSHSRA